MVASAETAPDFRERTQRQHLREIHRDLARADHVRRAPRGQQIRAGDVVVLRDDAKDVLDPDSARIGRAHEIADHLVGKLRGHGLLIELAVMQEPRHRRFQIAARLGYLCRDMREHRHRHVEARILRLQECGTRNQDVEAQLFVHRADLDGKPAAETRTHAVFEIFEFHRRTVGSNHDLAARVGQRVQRVAELLLHGAALQELKIVDDECVDAAQRFLEGDRRLVFQRSDEAVHEFLGSEIDRAFALCFEGMRRRLEKMGFAETHRGVDIKRIETRRAVRAQTCLDDLFCRRVREPVLPADDESGEGHARIERRTAGAVRAQIASGANCTAPAKAVAFRTSIRRDRSLLVGDLRTHDGGADDQFDLLDRGKLRLPVADQALEMMFLDPRLEKAGRNREAGTRTVAIDQMNAREPAHIGLFAEFGAQLLADALPPRAEIVSAVVCRNRIWIFVRNVHASLHLDW